MEILLNFPTMGGNLALLGNDWGEVERFLAEYGFDGIELMIKEGRPTKKVSLPPKHMVKGVHFPFWMAWLPMWRQDWDRLLEQCGSEENVVEYFGGRDREILVETYRWCEEIARQMGAKYVVIHADHVYLEEAFTFQFVQKDMDVLRATAEFVNAALNGKDGKVKVLFENSWWPGLRLSDATSTRKFLGMLSQPSKGLVLDTGHLMNSNPELRNEAEALEFIDKTLDELGEVSRHISVVHLQKSLPGQLTFSPQLRALGAFQQAKTMDEKYQVAYEYALAIDQHQPFREESVRRLLERIKPDYLTYELIAKSKEELADFVLSQHRCVGVKLPRGV